MTNPTTAPDAGHAMETMTVTVSRNELVSMISELLYQHTSRNQEQAIGDAERAVRRLVERPAAAHISDEELLAEYAAAHRINGYCAAWAEADERFSPPAVEPTDELRTELLCRLNHTAPARTAGTERGETA